MDWEIGKKCREKTTATVRAGDRKWINSSNAFATNGWSSAWPHPIHLEWNSRGEGDATGKLAWRSSISVGHVRQKGSFLHNGYPPLQRPLSLILLSPMRIWKLQINLAASDRNLFVDLFCLALVFSIISLSSVQGVWQLCNYLPIMCRESRRRKLPELSSSSAFVFIHILVGCTFPPLSSSALYDRLLLRGIVLVLHNMALGYVMHRVNVDWIL